MTLEAAKARLDPTEGESTGYISPSDVVASFDDLQDAWQTDDNFVAAAAANAQAAADAAAVDAAAAQAAADAAQSTADDAQTAADAAQTTANVALEAAGGGGGVNLNITNVKDFGALGDGSADDTSAITAAITAAGVGGTVYFPKCSGYYKVSSSLKPLTRQMWLGQHSPRYHWQEYSETTCAIRAAASFTGTALIHNTSTPVTGVTIRNLALLGNGESGTLDGVDLGPVSGSERAWRVEQCTLNAFGGAAVCGYGWVFTLRDCHIARNGYGIRPSAGADSSSRFNDAQILNNYVYFNYHGGLYLDGSGETGLTKIHGNRFERSGTQVSTTVDPNSNRDANACGIYITRASGVTLVGNTTDANARQGLRIQAAAHGSVNNITSVGNIWKRDGTGDNSSTMLPGVYVKDATYVNFHGDVITYGDPNDGGSGRIAPQYGLEIDTNDYLTWNGSIQLESSALTLSNGVKVTGTANWHSVINEPRQSMGTTSQRTASPLEGAFFYDKTLDKPIWWNGSNWKDAAGTTV